LSNQIAKIAIIDDGTFFKGIKIEDILKKKDVQEKVWRTLKNLTRFNVCLDAIISKAGRITDTELKEF
jgi:hypothetical protein